MDAQLGIPSPKTPDMEGSNYPGPQLIGLQADTDDGPSAPPRHPRGDASKNGVEFDDITPKGPEVLAAPAFGESKMPSPQGPSISYQPRTGDSRPGCKHGCTRVQMIMWRGPRR